MKITLDTKEDSKHIKHVIQFLQNISGEEVFTNYSQNTSILPEQPSVQPPTQGLFNMFDSPSNDTVSPALSEQQANDDYFNSIVNSQPVEEKQESKEESKDDEKPFKGIQIIEY